MKRTGRDGLYKRPGRAAWYCSYALPDGRRVQESTNTTDRHEAEEFRAQRITERGRGTLVVDAKKVTFEDLVQLVEQYYAAEQKKSKPYVSAALKQAFGGMLANAITTERVRQYKIDRVERDGVSVSTARAELRYLRQAFRLAQQAERLYRVPQFGDLQAEKRTGFVSEDAMRVILGCLPEWAQSIALFMFISGYRVRSEVLALRWANVDWKERLVRLARGTTKNGEPRTLPFGDVPELRQVFEAQLAIRAKIENATGTKSEWVFPIPGASCADRRYKLLTKAWKGACRKAKVGPFLLHDLRRSAVRNFERAMVSRSIGQSLSGHKTEGVYSDYAGSDLVAQREGMRKVAKLVKSMKLLKPAVAAA